MQKNGYEVVSTSNGLEAWEILQGQNPPRLVILDWMMPHLNGLEVIRRVRATASEPTPYILLLTARDRKSDIILGLETGADDYLAKPFDPGELRARVEVGRRMVKIQETLRIHQEILQHQATHDPLTGLLNRRSVLDHLHREVSRLERERGVLAVGMGDIDFFKRFNDVYGHQTGDDILCGLTQVFQRHSRQHDVFGRIGGEEFLIIAPGVKKDPPVVWFEHLRNTVHQTPFPTKSGALTCSISIGVTCVRQGQTIDDILEMADHALYQAKNRGRNCVICHEMSV